MGQSVAILTNPGLKHQVAIARALHAGFLVHGLEAEVVYRRSADADLVIALGPHWASSLRDGMLYIDRAYWGDPDCISMHWLKDGEKAFQGCDEPRDYPHLRAMKGAGQAIYLCEYGEQPPPGFRHYRPHPAESCAPGSLADVLSRFSEAWGRRTTALVEASVLGLRVHTDDPLSPVYPIANGGEREWWFNRLAWHNWHLLEVIEGAAWAYLSQQRQQPLSL